MCVCMICEYFLILFLHNSFIVLVYVCAAAIYLGYIVVAASDAFMLLMYQQHFVVAVIVAIFYCICHSFFPAAAFCASNLCKTPSRQQTPWRKMLQQPANKRRNACHPPFLRDA